MSFNNYKALYYSSTLTLDVSYYFVGNKTADFRMGGGLIGGGIYIFPKENWALVSSTPNYGFFAGLSAVAEWQFIYLRLSVIGDFNSKGRVFFSPMIGVKF